MNLQTGYIKPAKEINLSIMQNRALVELHTKVLDILTAVHMKMNGKCFLE